MFKESPKVSPFEVKVSPIPVSLEQLMYLFLTRSCLFPIPPRNLQTPLSTWKTELFEQRRLRVLKTVEGLKGPGTGFSILWTQQIRWVPSTVTHGSLSLRVSLPPFLSLSLSLSHTHNSGIPYKTIDTDKPRGIQGSLGKAGLRGRSKCSRPSSWLRRNTCS